MVDYSGNYATPRADLGMALMEYRREGGHKFIGTEILVPVETTRKAATFSAIPRGISTQQADTKRSARGGYNRVNISAKDKSYSCENHGLEGLVDDSERALYRHDFDADMATLEVVDRIVRQGQELRIKSLLFNETTWTGSDLFTDVSGSAPWTTASTNVIDQIIDAMEASRQLTGRTPNKLIMGHANLLRLLKNEKIRAQFPGAPRITRQMLEDSLAAIFGIRQLLVGDEVTNTADEGQDASLEDIWGDTYVMVAYCANPGASMQEGCVGRTFVWTDYQAEMFSIFSYREEQNESDVIREKSFTDELVYDPSYAHLLKVKA